MIYFSDKQYATFWSADIKEGYSLVSMSTSRKDKRDDSYKNSNWGFVRFVGKAHEKIEELERQARIVVKGGMSKESYDKEGEKMWPKNPQIVIFDWDFAEAYQSSGGPMDTAPMVVDDDDSDDIPF